MITVNAAPIADAGPDLIAAPGQEVVLDGSGSVDPDGSVVDWLWQFADGSEAHGPRVAKTFDTAGLQRVTLTVRDDTGLAEAFDVDEAIVAVNAPPVADRRAGTAGRAGGAGALRRRGLVRSGRQDRVLSLGLRRSGRTGDRGGDRADLRDAGGACGAADGGGRQRRPNATATAEVAIRVNHPPVAEAGPEIVTDQLYVTLDARGRATPTAIT